MWFTKLSLISFILVAGYVCYSTVQSRVIENAQPQVFELDVDDFTPETKSNNGSDVNEEVCKHGIVDAATRTKDGSTYFFRGDYYWKIDGGIVYGYPRLIAEDWKGVGSGPIDAAFTWNDGSTFIFKNDSYWRFYNLRPEKGYPRKIQDGFRGIPNNVDAAFVWDKNEKTYFFKGSRYWVYDQKEANPTSAPFDISRLVGMPSNISAAFRFANYHSYFFKGSKKYKYSYYEGRIVNSDKAWFKCNESIFEREISNRSEHEEVMTKIEELKNQVDLITNALKNGDFSKTV